MSANKSPAATRCNSYKHPGVTMNNSPQAGMQDYSGKFIADLELTQFDKDSLIRLHHAAGDLYCGRLQQWIYFLQEKFDLKEGIQIWREIAFHQYQFLRVNMRKIAESMNIRDRSGAKWITSDAGMGDWREHEGETTGMSGLMGFAKTLQWDAGQVAIQDTHIELVNGNPYHIIVTVPVSYTFDKRYKDVDKAAIGAGSDAENLETQGDSLPIDMCYSCLIGYGECARFFDPRVKEVCLKMPAYTRFNGRTVDDEPACQWELCVPNMEAKVNLSSIEDYDGPELDDYSGNFMPGMANDETRKRAFSKKALAGVLEYAGRMHWAIDGIYLNTCETYWGQDTAFALDAEMFRRHTKDDFQMVRDTMGILDDNVEGLFKTLQVNPIILARMPGLKLELLNSNHGIMTVIMDRSLSYCVKHGLGALHDHIFDTIDPLILHEWATLFNPDIQVTCLQRPKPLRTCWDIWWKETHRGREW